MRDLADSPLAFAFLDGRMLVREAGALEIPELSRFGPEVRRAGPIPLGLLGRRSCVALALPTFGADTLPTSSSGTQLLFSPESCWGDERSADVRRQTSEVNRQPLTVNRRSKQVCYYYTMK